MPKRLGSFNLKADPAALPAGVNLADGVVLTLDTLNAIRDFLLANSPAKYPAELVEQVRRELAAASTTAPVAAVDDRDDLAILEDALQGATASLVAEAAALHQRGLKPTNQRSSATEAPEGANALDALQARTNNVRKVLFKAFEDACQEAKLMVKKGGAA